MNRRSFFKAVTGFVAGVVATVVPKVKSGVSAKDICNKALEKINEGRVFHTYSSSEPKEHPAMTAGEWVDAQFNPVKELQLGEPFTGKIVSMTTFQGNLWIATDRGVYRVRNVLG